MSEPELELPDKELNDKAKALLIKKLAAMPLDRRKPSIAKIFRSLETIAEHGIQEHMASSFKLIAESKERFNAKTFAALADEFARITHTQEQDLLTRLEGFMYRDALLAKHRDLRNHEWAEVTRDFKSGLEQSAYDVKAQVRKVYEICFPFRDLRKVLADKALKAWDEPVPEAALSAVFDEWDQGVLKMHELLIKTLTDIFEQTKKGRTHET